jgi:lipoyl(octanoyl) transferase
MTAGVKWHPVSVLEVRRLGVVDYADARAMQLALVQQRQAGNIPDVLLLLQHPPVITLGVKGDGGRSNILASETTLAELGVGVHEAGRGGDVTYHGPGQIVGYPIIDLRPDRCDVHRYVRDVEEVMIRVCADYGLTAGRIRGMTGAWLDADAARASKIGAIGVRISRWVTSHGFAFNVSTRLDHFDLIVPCGLAGRGVTSIEEATGTHVRLDEVEDAFVRHFAAVFDREVITASATPRPATAVTSIRT